MNKMKNPEFEVIKFESNDVIATSGFFNGMKVYFKDGFLFNYDESTGEVGDAFTKEQIDNETGLIDSFNSQEGHGSLSEGVYWFANGKWNHN